MCIILIKVDLNKRSKINSSNLSFVCGPLNADAIFLFEGEDGRNKGKTS